MVINGTARCKSIDPVTVVKYFVTSSVGVARTRKQNSWAAFFFCVVFGIALFHLILLLNQVFALT